MKEITLKPGDDLTHVAVAQLGLRWPPRWSAGLRLKPQEFSRFHMVWGPNKEKQT